MADDTQSPTEEFSFLDLALLFAENLRLLVLVPLAAGVLAFGITFLIRPMYTATARLLPPQQQQSAASALLTTQLGALAGGVGGSLGLKNPADLYVAMLRSRTVADHLLSRFKLRELYDEKYGEDARKELAGRTRIIAGKEGLITIEVDDHDPKRAADMANSYVEALRELTQTLAVTEAAQRRLFFERQLKQTKDALTRAEIALRGSGINEATLKTVPQSALEALARLKAQVTAQEVKLAALRGFMTESNPEYKQAQQELIALRTQLSRAEQIDGSKATGAGAEYVARFREFKYYETLFDLMAKQYEIARLDEAREGAVIQVMDTAVPPERISQPKRLVTGVLWALTTLFVLIMGLLLRLVFHAAKGNRSSADKIHRLLVFLRLDRR